MPSLAAFGLFFVQGLLLLQAHNLGIPTGRKREEGGQNKFGLLRLFLGKRHAFWQAGSGGFLLLLFQVLGTVPIPLVPARHKPGRATLTRLRAWAAPVSWPTCPT